MVKVRMLRFEITPDFERAVHEVVARIPKGKVATYGQVAEMVGMSGAAQEVGVIMSRVPSGLGLPCHRVVSQSGAMSPGYVFGGEGVQMARLKAEGVSFRNDGKIDMERHLWGGIEQLELF